MSIVLGRNKTKNIIIVYRYIRNVPLLYTNNARVGRIVFSTKLLL